MSKLETVLNEESEETRKRFCPASAYDPGRFAARYRWGMAGALVIGYVVVWIATAMIGLNLRIDLRFFLSCLGAAALYSVFHQFSDHWFKRQTRKFFETLSEDQLYDCLDHFDGDLLDDLIGRLESFEQKRNASNQSDR